MVTKRRQVTGRRDDGWRPDPGFWLHNDGLEEIWDGDRLIPGGLPVASAMWAAARTATWRLWLRNPAIVPPEAAMAFDGLACGARARESVEAFREANPSAAAAIVVELDAFVTLAEQDAADLRAIRDANRRSRHDDAAPAEPEGPPPDEDDDEGGIWTPAPYDPEPPEPPPATVVELEPRRRNRHGTYDPPTR